MHFQKFVEQYIEEVQNSSSSDFPILIWMQTYICILLYTIGNSKVKQNTDIVVFETTGAINYQFTPTNMFKIQILEIRRIFNSSLVHTVNIKISLNMFYILLEFSR